MHPENLGKTVEVKASNRPIKVTYLVPYEATPKNHMILDGVLHESYARWAGAYTLIVPTNSKVFYIPNTRLWAVLKGSTPIHGHSDTL